MGKEFYSCQSYPFSTTFVPYNIFPLLIGIFRKKAWPLLVDCRPNKLPLLRGLIKIDIFPSLILGVVLHFFPIPDCYDRELRTLRNFKLFLLLTSEEGGPISAQVDTTKKLNANRLAMNLSFGRFTLLACCGNKKRLVHWHVARTWARGWNAKEVSSEINRKAFCLS